MRTRMIVYAALVAAAYAVLTYAVAPVAYGPLQFRLSEALKPLALLGPEFALGFAVGNALSNLTSPWGFWDWGVMPWVNLVGCLLCWRIGKVSGFVGCALLSVIISVGVAFFPLGMTLRAPFWPTFWMVLASEAVLIVGGYFVWRMSGGLRILEERCQLKSSG